MSRLFALPLLLAFVLSGCATPANSGSSNPDTAVSDSGSAGTAPSVSVAGKGTAVIAVTDRAGKALPLIPIEVRTVGWPMPAELAIEIARMTDDKGEYHWLNLPPGQYEFTARVPGGTATASKGVTVAADQITRVELELQYS